MGTFLNYMQMLQQPQVGMQQQPVQQPQQQQMPQVDTSNAMQSLAQLMGPTPAEREAQERKLLENKQKMLAWTGLFDGLRQLGNLYFTSKGATPQQYTDKPYQQIEQNYQQERQLQDNLHKYSQAYANQLFNWQQKIGDAERRNKIADAQATYYNTRDEMARLKGENDRLRAEAAARVSDARAKNIEAKTNEIKNFGPLKAEEIISRIRKNNRYAGNTYSGGRGTSSDPYAEIAELLNDDPETIGPILESENIGLYDPKTKEFTFKRNMTKGMASIAAKRAKGRNTTKPSGESDGIDYGELGNFSMRRRR